MIRYFSTTALLMFSFFAVQAETNWESLSIDSKIALTQESLTRLLTNPEQNAPAIRNHAVQLELLLGQCFAWGGEDRTDTSVLSDESVFGLDASEIHHDTLQEELDSHSDSFFLPGWEDQLTDPSELYKLPPSDAIEDHAELIKPISKTSEIKPSPALKPIIKPKSSKTDRMALEKELEQMHHNPAENQREITKYRNYLDAVDKGLAAPPVSTQNMRAERDRSLNSEIQRAQNEMRTLPPTDPLYAQKSAELLRMQAQQANERSNSSAGTNR